MIELTQIGVQRCLVLEVLGEICARAGWLLDGLSRGTQIELRADDFDTSDDLLNDVLALIVTLVLVMIWPRIVVLRSIFLLLLGIGLVHFTLQLVYPVLEALLTLFVDTHLQQLLVLL